jgi:hypothetical protein
MQETILNNITFEPDLGLLMENLRLKEGSSYVDDLKSLVSQAQAVARPKALYRVAPIEDKGDSTVVIDGVTFTSRVLRVNLEQANRVFLFVATGGVEVETWMQSVEDMLYQYWAGAIAEMALRSAIVALHEHLLERYRPGHISVMHPGSLGDWPIKQQRPLFDLLGDTKAAIGVELLESLLMYPTKSASGIYFPTEESFESCQLCPMENCPNRKAPYDETLYERKYCPAVT